LGYYANEGSPFSAWANEGDFITAPLLTPLFGACIAEQAIEVFERTGASQILEIGAGTGRLAADVLNHLKQQHIDVTYYILELSATLRAQQQATLADAAHHVVWLDALPTAFDGLILGNEVLDAMPVKLIGMSQGAWFERGVVWQDGALAFEDRATALKLPTDDDWQHALKDSAASYLSETHDQQIAFMRSLGACLGKGVILMLDYGFPAHEFYHPQRNTGTLMCHIQHVAHADALYHAGVQDLTAHVNFSALKNIESLNAIGYTNQANFLINTGLLNQLAAQSDETQRSHANRAHKLISEAEMGELFKVMAWEKGLNLNDDDVLIGFERGDRLHSL
jgi:SAM-dependent MidA family methyltransferase